MQWQCHTNKYLEDSDEKHFYIDISFYHLLNSRENISDSSLMSRRPSVLVFCLG